MSSESFREKAIVTEARRIVRKAKRLQKTLYQLAFISVSDNPYSEEAYNMLLEFVKQGVISKRQLDKIIEDVKRWKEIRYREKMDNYAKETSETVEDIRGEMP